MAKKDPRTQHELWDSAHKIWLAGLGALSAAEEEGEKLFKTLVSRGEKYEHRVKEPVEKVSGTMKKARSRAGKTLESIESAVDDQVTSVLNRLGVPTRDEIAKLSRKVERLTQAVEGKRAGKARTTRKKKAASRKSTKRATRGAS
jgi:poly(hydroxyalkanoate) granule-associated protein